MTGQARCGTRRLSAVIGVSMDVAYEDLESLAEGWARVKPFAAAHDLAYAILLDAGASRRHISQDSVDGARVE